MSRACHYADHGNKDGNPAIVMGTCDRKPKEWFTYHKDEGEGDYYTADIIKIDFDNWIKAGMKID